MCSRIKVRHNVGFTRRFQTTVEVINPSVIRADKGALVPCCGFAHLRTAVTADVVHRPNLAIITADDNNRVLTNLDKLVVALCRDFTAVQRIQPTLKHKMIELSLVDQVRAIEIGIHGVLRTLALGRELLAHSLEGIVNLCRNEMHKPSALVPVFGVYAAG